MPRIPAPSNTRLSIGRCPITTKEVTSNNAKKDDFLNIIGSFQMFKLAILEKKNIVVEILTKDKLRVNVLLVSPWLIDMNERTSLPSRPRSAIHNRQPAFAWLRRTRSAIRNPSIRNVLHSSPILAALNSIHCHFAHTVPLRQLFYSDVAVLIV
jgi:hypothetical protein